MDVSPVKKLDFLSTGKAHDGLGAVAPAQCLDTKNKAIDGGQKDEKLAVAPTIKGQESDEPLLQENPHRFVLFPIKYHEVCVPNPAYCRRLTRSLDLANVQEGRGFLLDG